MFVVPIRAYSKCGLDVLVAVAYQHCRLGESLEISLKLKYVQFGCKSKLCTKWLAWNSDQVLL